MLKATFDVSCAVQIIGALDIIENAKIPPLCNDVLETPSKYAAEFKRQIHAGEVKGLTFHQIDVELAFQLYHFFAECAKEWGDYGPCNGGLLWGCMEDCIYVLLKPADKQWLDLIDTHKNLLV